MWSNYYTVEDDVNAKDANERERRNSKLTPMGRTVQVKREVEETEERNSKRVNTDEIKFRPPRKAPVGGKWTEDEDRRLRDIVERYGAKNWKKLSQILGNVRSDVQCLHRWNKVLRPGLSKGPWTAEEDKIVKDMVLKHGAGNIKWSVIAAQLPGRIGKQCRERWFNHLDPEIKKGDWSPAEDDVLFQTQRLHGNRWSEIAKLLPGRTENAVKNRWNSSARKKWLRDNGLTENDQAPEFPTPLSSERSSTSSSSSQQQQQQRGFTDIASSHVRRPPALHVPPPEIPDDDDNDDDTPVDGRPSLMQGPLLDHPQPCFLESAEHIDSVDLASTFEDRTSETMRISDLRPSEVMDLSKVLMDIEHDTPRVVKQEVFPDPVFPQQQQLHDAAHVAMERIVATSGPNGEIPLSMLPYFHFLNVRKSPSHSL